MDHTPEKDQSRHLQAFEQWLAASPVAPRPGLLARTRRRMNEEDQGLEKRIDALFAQDPSLSNPRMAIEVRERLGQYEKAEKVVWFQWLTPVAAALVLGVAFFSFQNKASYQETPLPMEAQVVVSSPAERGNDPELTRIFALASNLQGASDMSRLQSVDDLAFLFE